MLKISRLADYAVVILASMSKQPKGLMKTAEVSTLVALPGPTVSKVLKLLVKQGLVDSVRGAGGGYRLSAAPANISVAAIISAVDGPITLTACVEGNAGSCDYRRSCPVHGRWDNVNTAIYNALAEVTLADMIARERNFSFLVEEDTDNGHL